jgi:hypothetical protein
MAPYAAPDFNKLKDAVASDLRDPSYKTFTEPQIGNLVNEGMAELDRLRPWERYVFLGWSYPSYTMTVSLQTIITIEVQELEDGPWRPVPQSARILEGIAQDGWDQWGDTLFLPQHMLLSADMTFRALTYWERDPFTTVETQVAQFFDMTDEQLVRCYARWAALESLLHDRTLYQQWQTQANNSDVSPTQLLQMASTYKQEWSDLRKRAVRLRRAV